MFTSLLAKSGVRKSIISPLISIQNTSVIPFWKAFKAIIAKNRFILFQLKTLLPKTSERFSVEYYDKMVGCFFKDDGKSRPGVYCNDFQWVTVSSQPTCSTNSRVRALALALTHPLCLLY